MRIGQILVRDGSITDEQLNTALQVQTRFGGRLGTSLVELGFIDLDTLARALGRLHGVPPVLQKHLASLDPTAPRLLSARLADHYGAIPLGNSARSPHRLIVAFRDPSMKIVEEVSFATSKRVEPGVAPELLVGKLLERLYGIKRKVAVPYVNADLAAEPAPRRSAGTMAPPRSPGTIAPPRSPGTMAPPPRSASTMAPPRSSGTISPPRSPETTRPISEPAPSLGAPAAASPSGYAPPKAPSSRADDAYPSSFPAHSLPPVASAPPARASGPHPTTRPVGHTPAPPAASPENTPSSAKFRHYASLPPALAHLEADQPPSTRIPPSLGRSIPERIPAAPPVPSFTPHHTPFFDSASETPLPGATNGANRPSVFARSQLPDSTPSQSSNPPHVSGVHALPLEAGPPSQRKPAFVPAAPPTPAPASPVALAAPTVIEVPSAPRRPARRGPAVTIDIPVSSLPSIDEPPSTPSSLTASAPPAQSGPITAPQAPITAGARPALGAIDATELIARAKTRNDVGDAIVDYLRSTYGCGLVLIVKDEMALGWKGFADGVDDSLLETISIPLGTPSMLNVAYASQAVFRGSPPNEGTALHSRLWKLLRAQSPREVIVAPVILRERVVNLVYAHAAFGGILPTRATGDMTRVATAAAEGYAAVIRKK